MKKHLFIIIAILILVLVLQCENNKNEINSIRSSHSMENNEHEKAINKLGLEVNTQKLITFNSRKKAKLYLDEVHGLNKKIKTQVKASVKTEIVGVEALPVRDSALISRDSTGDRTPLPQTYEASNEFYKIRYTIRKDFSSQIDTARFMLYPRITIGYKDRGFIGNVLKKREPVVTFETGSPFSSVEKLSNITIEKKREYKGLKAGLLVGSFIFGRLSHKL